jgi:hypothetical protein
VGIQPVLVLVLAVRYQVQLKQHVEVVGVVGVVGQPQPQQSVRI